ncbi:hypothetical protein [Chroogloeocystis siderophila]|jgi:hypothetical protein|uniref:Uncharacterized protein n=1 Tax=Chroogloeocystis siderophila 5.2 s.c.1 TaxID=247279 RepID=A0A1U7HX93_9CHRO|nr:hypothetical protein [Chroogloeocystis siderophila]OKH28206.1 hypothetical protein NIES1031_06495 [Chroogloeocystis siderophila 5.2 s.c.1]
MLSLKIPWVAFTLLLLTYITLGWLLETFDDPVAAWIIIVIGIFLLSVLLASPWSQIRNDLGLLFKSDTRAFFVAVIGAFLTVLIISWFHIFAHGLVAVSAATLFRLDAQTVGWSETQIFWMLTAVSIAGLALGAFAQNWIYWQL